MNKIRKLKTRIYCRNGIERDLEGQYIKYKEQKFQKKKEKKEEKRDTRRKSAKLSRDISGEISRGELSE